MTELWQTPPEYFLELARHLDEVDQELDVLQSQYNGTRDPRTAGNAIERIQWVLESIVYWEPGVTRERWAYNALHGLAHAEVRRADGRLEDDHVLRVELRQLERDLENLGGHLRAYFHKKGDYLDADGVHELARPDVEEARDLAAINYHGTALLVMGRAPHCTA